MDPVHGSQSPQGGNTPQKNSGAAKNTASKKAAPKGSNDKNANFMASLSADQYMYKRPKYGDIVSGVVVRAAPHEVLVDIGTKSEAIIAPKEVEELAREGKRPQVG
ncbi:MAG TPA: hypothetical protein VFD70_27035, partial [Anaerolineae bacterium]|nr:hypothetical protein [Anaerolineae bacterium]